MTAGHVLAYAMQYHFLFPILINLTLTSAVVLL